MASFVAFQGVGLPPYTAEAEVEIRSDGTTELLAGVVDIGAGQRTIFPMVAAEELGVRAEDMLVVIGDTDRTPYAPACHASRCTAEVAAAVLQAAAEARQQLFEITAPHLGADIEDLRSKDGTIYLKSNPSRTLDFKKACQWIGHAKPIRGKGSRAANPDSPMFGAFGAQAVEVEVDTGTGEVRVLRVAAAHEFGRAINPKLCLSQIYGGVQFGMGYALMEEGLFDPKTGKMLNNNFHQYRMATSRDYPLVDNFMVEDPEPYLAYGAKGGGENSNTPLAAAIRNAIHHAAGIWLNELPMTPDKVLRAIHEKEKGGQSSAS